MQQERQSRPRTLPYTAALLRRPADARWTARKSCRAARAKPLCTCMGAVHLQQLQGPATPSHTIQQRGTDVPGELQAQRTISSARMPLMPLSYRWMSQLRPCIWYSRMVPFLMQLGCESSLHAHLVNRMPCFCRPSGEMHSAGQNPKCKAQPKNSRGHLGLLLGYLCLGYLAQIHVGFSAQAPGGDPFSAWHPEGMGCMVQHSLVPNTYCLLHFYDWTPARAQMPEPPACNMIGYQGMIDLS